MMALMGLLVIPDPKDYAEIQAVVSLVGLVPLDLMVPVGHRDLMVPLASLDLLARRERED